MELLSGGELLLRSRCTEQEAQRLMRQLGSAVQYMHSCNIVHGDIKPENIVYAHNGSNAIVKMVDFGFAQLLNSPNESFHTTRFTLPYAAPEVITQETYNKSCDMWSLGATLYFMLSGSHPFGNKVSDIMRRIGIGQIDFSDNVWYDVSPMAKNVILSLLNLDPKKRLTADDLMNHPWLVRNVPKSDVYNMIQLDQTSTGTSWIFENEESQSQVGNSKLNARNKLRKTSKSHNASSERLKTCHLNPFVQISPLPTNINSATIPIALTQSPNLPSCSKGKKQKSIPNIIKKTKGSIKRSKRNVSYKQRQLKNKIKVNEICNNSNNDKSSNNDNYSRPVTRSVTRKCNTNKILDNFTELYNCSQANKRQAKKKKVT